MVVALSTTSGLSGQNGFLAILVLRRKFRTQVYGWEQRIKTIIISITLFLHNIELNYIELHISHNLSNELN